MTPAKVFFVLMTFAFGVSITYQGDGSRAGALAGISANAGGAQAAKLVIPVKLRCGIFNGKFACINTKKQGKTNKPKTDDQAGEGGGQPGTQNTGACPKGYILVKGKDGYSCEIDPATLPKAGEPEICCTIQATEKDGSPASGLGQCRKTEADARDAVAALAQANSLIIKSTTCEPRK